MNRQLGDKPSTKEEELHRETCRILFQVRPPPSNLALDHRKLLRSSREEGELVVLTKTQGNACVVLDTACCMNKIAELLADQAYKKINKNLRV